MVSPAGIKVENSTVRQFQYFTIQIVVSEKGIVARDRHLYDASVTTILGTLGKLEIAPSSYSGLPFFGPKSMCGRMQRSVGRQKEHVFQQAGNSVQGGRDESDRS